MVDWSTSSGRWALCCSGQFSYGLLINVAEYLDVVVVMVDMAFGFDSKLLLFLLDVVLVNPWQRKSWFSCNFVNQEQDQVQDSIQEKGSFGFFNYH